MSRSRTARKTAPSSGHNLIGIASGNNADGSAGGWIASDLLGTTSSPINPKLSALGNNGGPTQTMLPAANSPAVNAGDDSLDSDISTDQRGLPRGSGTVDIGSVEVQPTGKDSLQFTAASSQSVVVGVNKNFSLGSFTESNATWPYTVVVDWGDQSADTTFTFIAAGELPGEPHAFGNSGPYTVHVTLTDASGVSSNASFGVIVSASSGATSVGLHTSTQNILSNQSLTLTATVYPANSSNASDAGQVTFFLGVIELGTAETIDGVATLVTTNALPIGANIVTADYFGADNFTTINSATGISVTVAAAPTTTTLATSLASAASGQRPIHAASPRQSTPARRSTSLPR